MNHFHTPVMLKASVEGLNIDPSGTYVDATFGGGGHSREILSRLDRGKLLSFDQDEEAVRNAFIDERFVLIHHNFRYLENFLRYYGLQEVDGILADLGVSSHDFDEAERGFSFRYDAALDMRMNRQSELTAAAVVNRYPAGELARIFREYGEIRNARQVASALVTARAVAEVKTTGQLLAIAGSVIPRPHDRKFPARLFQALRMEVNDELGALRMLLLASLRVLKTGGRLVVITYHSLEDRLVKNFMKAGNPEGIREQDFYGHFSHPFRLINNRVIVPGDAEIRENPRSRSAKLRIAEKRG